MLENGIQVAVHDGYHARAVALVDGAWILFGIGREEGKGKQDQSGGDLHAGDYTANRHCDGVEAGDIWRGLNGSW